MTLKNISNKYGLLVMDNKEQNQVTREESTRNKKNVIIYSCYLKKSVILA